MTPQRAKATEYILNLPIVCRANLPDEHKSCHICMEDFKTQTSKTLELPVRLPCSHILGTICMINWLSSNGDNSPRGCPLCRAALLPQTQPPPSESRSAYRDGFRRRENNVWFDEVADQRLIDMRRGNWPRQERQIPPLPPASPPLPQVQPPFEPQSGQRGGPRARENTVGFDDEAARQRIIDMGRVRWPRPERRLPSRPPTSPPLPPMRPEIFAPLRGPPASPPLPPMAPGHRTRFG